MTTLRTRTYQDRCSDAFREDVYADGKALRDSWYPGVDRCPECECILVKGKMHIDHVNVPFVDLRQQFLAQENLSLEDVRYTTRMVKSWTFRTLKDDGLRGRWQKFHRENAKLRWLCADCNTRLGVASRA